MPFSRLEVHAHVQIYWVETKLCRLKHFHAFTLPVALARHVHCMLTVHSLRFSPRHIHVTFTARSLGWDFWSRNFIRWTFARTLHRTLDLYANACIPHVRFECVPSCKGTHYSHFTSCLSHASFRVLLLIICLPRQGTPVAPTKLPQSFPHP